MAVFVPHPSYHLPRCGVQKNRLLKCLLHGGDFLCKRMCRGAHLEAPETDLPLLLPPVNVPSTVMEAMCRQDALQPFSKSSKLPPASQQRSVVFPQTPCSRNFSLLDKSGPMESGFNQMNVKNQRVLASPTSTSQLHSEFSDWHLWKCGQCFKTFTQRILLQMHVCTQNPDR